MLRILRRCKRCHNAGPGQEGRSFVAGVLQRLLTAAALEAESDEIRVQPEAPRTKPPV